MKMIPFLKFRKSRSDHDKEKRLLCQFSFFNFKTKIKNPFVFEFPFVKIKPKHPEPELQPSGEFFLCSFKKYIITRERPFETHARVNIEPGVERRVGEMWGDACIVLVRLEVETCRGRM